MNSSVQKFTKIEKCIQWGFVLLAFTIMFLWAWNANYFSGPDEPMRYKVAKYIFDHHGELPVGDCKEIRDEIWGFSYAYFPILSYMISALFMTIASWFGVGSDHLIQVARMADVLFITMMAYTVTLIGRRLFDREKRWLFSALVIFLPGVLFMGSYVNTDSLALFAVSLILLAWVRYLDEGWTWKNCILLSIGMGICFLSYYNAYGWILWSFLFFCVTILVLPKQQPLKERIRFLLTRGIVVSAITLGISGWWFVRNYILYDGDILARNACNAAGEKYAWDAYKPSNHPTPQKNGWSFKQFLFYQDPGWPHNWMVMVMVSFVGTFGFFNIFMDETVSKIYLLFLLLSAAGCILMIREFHWRKYSVTIDRKVEDGIKVVTKTTRIEPELSQKGIFNLAMLGAMLTPIILFMNYAYTSDNQAQGRYILSAVFPIMYFVVRGLDQILIRVIKQEKVRRIVYAVITVIWVAGAVLTYVYTVAPKYS
ncbi:MAG: hypothetical protein Q4B47_04750 [Eubacteriales bacterium]|nr:hypothetical protein [Eubacteriales bacterium]